MKDLKSVGDEVRCSFLVCCKSFLNLLSSHVFCDRTKGFLPKVEETGENKVKIFLSFIIKQTGYF